MRFQDKVIQVPKMDTVADQIKRHLEDRPHEAAVFLAPEGDNGLKVFVRGTGGAWWRYQYNQPGESFGLDVLIQDCPEGVLVTRADVDDQLLDEPRA